MPAGMISEAWARVRDRWHRVDKVRGRKARCRCSGRWGRFSEVVLAPRAAEPEEVCVDCVLLPVPS